MTELWLSSYTWYIQLKNCCGNLRFSIQNNTHLINSLPSLSEQWQSLKYFLLIKLKIKAIINIKNTKIIPISKYMIASIQLEKKQLVFIIVDIFFLWEFWWKDNGNLQQLSVGSAELKKTRSEIWQNARLRQWKQCKSKGNSRY